MSKKLHAKDLKKDQLVETLGEIWGPAVHWFEENRRTVIWTLGAVVVLLLGAAAVGSMRQSSERSAQAALGAALEKLSEAETSAGEGETVDWAALQSEFKKVADEHGGTASRVAEHYLGVAQLRAGDAAGAVATLSSASAGAFDDWRTPLTLSVLAAAQEQAGDPSSAEATLKKLRERNALGFPADAAAMELARFYERQGRLDEARALYAELAAELDAANAAAEAGETDFEPPSVYASQAQARLDELEG